MPQVSVIIPLYNKGQYIARALDSVFAQMFEDFEVLVVDDGSTDNGPEIVAGYTDPRLRMIRQVNAGPGAARNRGVAESKAAYLAFLDADDEWLPDFLSACYSSLKEFPGCDLCVSSFYYEAVDGHIGYRYDQGIWTLPTDLTPSEFKYHLDSLHSAGTILCTRQLLEKFHGFCENRCLYGEDSHLWLKALLNCQIYRLSTPLFIYHTECSNLGVGSGKKYFPPKPFLFEPHSVRAVCPARYSDMLERFLSYYALLAYHSALGMGKGELCKEFIDLYPLMKQVDIFRYVSLRFKLKFPTIYLFIKKITRKNCC